MRNSVLVEDQEHCVICGREYVNRHHVFEGTANRKTSDKYGFWLPLCHKHHNGSNDAINFNKKLDLKWKRRAQRIYELTHTRQEFINEFIRSYL